VMDDRSLLIVDDEAAIRFVLAEYFRGRGWSVDAVETRQEAETLLAGTPYSVVIVDVSLGGTKGDEGLDVVDAARRLRPRTRVVLLTGNATSELEAEARRRGIHAFVEKPLPLPRLEAIVDRLATAAL
jgi:DNA-binding NtrC family response regulator